MGSAVRFRNVSLRYGTVCALDRVNLDIADGEFFGILGPSGSGKTSCLRLIAGFERPTSGAIELHDRSAETVPPYDRDVNTVFQDYALFAHMTVEQNVAYGLMVKGVGRPERHSRVTEMPRWCVSRVSAACVPASYRGDSGSESRSLVL